MEIVQKHFPNLTTQQIQQFEQLPALYKFWNEKINVISRKDIDSIDVHHILHSLSIAKHIQFEPGARILDIGTGGGFPGIPLAIMFPECQFTLVDSIGKKITVVNEVVNALGLKNVHTYHTRVETLAENQFHYVVTRAVAVLGTLWQWAKPLIIKGRQTASFANGLFALKGGDLTEEIANSGVRPHTWPINGLFGENYYEEKQIVYVPK